MNDPQVLNHFRLELLLKEANKILQSYFHQCWKRQNNGAEWPNDSAAGKTIEALFPKGNPPLGLKKKQREMLAKGDCTLWDITMIHQVLEKVVPKAARDKTHFQAIMAIVEVRNKQAHRADAAVDDATFTSNFDKVAKALVLLGLDAAVAENLRTKPLVAEVLEPKVTPAQEVPAALALKNRGNEEHKARNFIKAVDFYTKALVVEGQTDHMLAILYSNRSASHLEAGQLDNATGDAKTARQLSPLWWRAHYRLARCYHRRNKLVKAIASLNVADSLSPGNKEVEAERSKCRHEKGILDREESFNPNHMPRTVQEVNEQGTAAFGADMRLGGYSASDTSPAKAAAINKATPGRFDCSCGHQFMLGDSKANITIDYQKALQHFSKAASVKNAEGYYNLALMYSKGLGVPVDHSKAISYLRLAAQQPPEFLPPDSGRRIGVAEAEFSLGLRYQEGVGVEKNLSEAVQWYERAVSHGAPNAANNLGLLYLNGSGVPRDLQKAISLLKLSAEGGDPNAMMTLSGIMERLGDRKMALEWLRRAEKTGLLSAQIALQEMETKGNTVVVDQPGPAPRDPFQHLANEWMSSSLGQRALLPGALKVKERHFDARMLKEAEAKGSKTAAQLLEAKSHFDAGLAHLANGEGKEGVISIGEAILITEVVCWLPLETEAALRVQLPQLMKEGIEVSALDKAARFCWIIVCQNDSDALIPFLQRCTTKYPGEPRFWDIRARLHDLKEWEKGLLVAKEALIRHPSDVNLLFTLGGFAGVKVELQAESRAAYHSFLAAAPPDHQFVPYAHYTLAMQQVLSTLPMQWDIEKLLQPGLEAEGAQLPCFLPVMSSEKQMLKHALNLSASTASSLEAEANQAAERAKQRQRKAWLEDLRRVQQFSAFRQAAASFKVLLQDRSGYVTAAWTTTPLERASAAPMEAILKSISLEEMDPRADVIYTGRVLSVTVAAKPHWTGSSLAMIVQDASGECNRLFIYGKLDFKPALGNILGITNPHHRIMKDQKTGIRVDDPRSVIKTGSTSKPCNACGAADSRYSCGKCDVLYCSKDCQLLDWKEYSHKLVCFAS